MHSRNHNKTSVLENPLFRNSLLFVALGMLPAICIASNVTLQGNFTADDNVQLFSVALGAPAAIDFRSYGYAGGTPSNGSTVPAGGFDTILTLFSASGSFTRTTMTERARPSIPQPAWRAMRASLPISPLAATFWPSLQYDNFSIGDLGNGFTEAGNPNFTADPTFASGGPCPGNMFRDISGTAGRCRSANWTVDFLNVESVTPVTATPEPSALLLAAVGLGLLLASRGRNLRKRSTLTVAILAALATVPLKAQTTNCPSVSGPDYCPVSDFLNGNRALLKIQDIEVIDLGNNASQGKITQLGTSSSSPPTVRQWLRG